MRIFILFLVTIMIGRENLKSDKYEYDEQGRPITPNNEDLNKLPSDGGELWNRLVFETSPYLLQHAANPIDWHPWSEEAFLKAKDFNKPTTTADPAMSYFISSMNLAGFKEIPPVSKHTPLPTKAKGFFDFFSPFHSIVTKNDSFILPWPTPKRAFNPILFISFSL